jgi:hypothetical protein
MPKTIHGCDVLGLLLGIGISIASASCSITSVGIDTPNGKAFAVETRRLPNSANDASARMELRIAGASIKEDSRGEISGQQSLVGAAGLEWEAVSPEATSAK